MDSTVKDSSISTLSSFQREVDQFLQQYKEGYFPPLALLARLTEEVGEFAREINHQFGPKKKKPEEPVGSPAEELADILFVVICFANVLGVDLEQAYREVMTKYRVRDSQRWTRRTSELP